MFIMDSTTSVSKGVFVFKNGLKKRSTEHSTQQLLKSSHSLLDVEETQSAYYTTYAETWRSAKRAIKKIQKKSNRKVMKTVVDFINMCYEQSEDNILPTAAVLTGINQPDHFELFERLAGQICQTTCATAAILQSRDCSALKNSIEALVREVINPKIADENSDSVKLRRSQCTMEILCSWFHTHKNPGHKLVVILPDFETFCTDVLEDFIMVMSFHCHRIPIVLVLGVATAVTALHSSLPYHVTSRMRLQIFKIKPATNGLNDVIENVILSPLNNFHLSGKTLQLLTDIFLFYDFSINGFINGYKYCLFEHFYHGNVYGLCDNYENSIEKLKLVSDEGVETLREMLSFRPYVESLQSPKEVIAILTDNEYFKRQLPEILENCQIFLKTFHCFTVLLTELVKNLPKAPLGRLRREIYGACASTDVTETVEFKQCWQILCFMSKEEFISTITDSLTVTNNFLDENFKNKDCIESTCKSNVNKKLEKVRELLSEVLNSGIETEGNSDRVKADLKNLARHELREKLLEMSKQEKKLSGFTTSVKATLDFIQKEIISECLIPFNKCKIPLIELYVFSDVFAVRQHIFGSPRAALHTALNSPQIYLQCECCYLETSTSLIATLPDLSVAYKLHLECGKMINLFDWLQSFQSVVDNQNEDQDQLDPKIQARFTRAVAELQFLGFIKSSKRKIDHVSRLTW